MRPNSPYAASKAGGDLLCRAYVVTYGMPVMVIRGTNAFGPRQQSLHGRLAQYALERQGRLTDDPDARYNATMTQHAAALARGEWVKYKPIYNRFGFTKGRLSSTL